MGFRNAEEFGRQSTAETTHRAVGILIALRVPDEDPTAEVFYSEANLSEILGKTQSNIGRSVRVLRDLGELQITRRPGKTNLVQVGWKQGVPDHSSKRPRAEMTPLRVSRTGSGHREPRGDNPTPRAEMTPLPRGDDPTPPAEMTHELKYRKVLKQKRAPSALPPVAAAASGAGSAEGRFINAFLATGYSEVTETTAAKLAKSSGTSLDALFDDDVVSRFNTMIRLDRSAVARAV